VVKDKVGKPPGELGCKSLKCDVFFYSFSVLTPLVRQQEGHPTCKTLGVGFVGGHGLTGALHVL